MLVDEQPCATPPADVFAKPAEVFPKEEQVSVRSFAGKRALIVEDDELLARFLDRMLRAAGFEVEIAHTGVMAVQVLHRDLDVVVLDLNLPEMDGIAVLQELRSRFHLLPVLVLTARVRSECAVLALENGADDCLTKPFSYVELLARLRALLRRQNPERALPKTCFGDLALNRADFRATRNGKHIDLTPREFGLLEYLMRSPGTAVPRAVLLKDLWGEDGPSGSNVVDVYMKYVRDKIDLPGLPKLIRTIRGVGYAIGEA